MTHSFIHQNIPIEDHVLDIEMGGSGPALLMLHGFPETKMAWNKIAPALAAKKTIVLPDIPGYGASTGPDPAPDYINYSKRRMGRILDALMTQLGFDSYSLVGHDRGARIAYRMALDYPDRITSLALLNIIPTIEVAERINYERAYNMENWFFLSQPAPLPETMIHDHAEFYLNHILDSWSEKPELISNESRTAYVKHFKRTAVIEKICAEYRAFKYDIQYDHEDRCMNKRIQCPVLLLWSEKDFSSQTDNPLQIWKNWADDVSGKGLPGGHFLMEECPDLVLNEFVVFFK